MIWAGSGTKTDANGTFWIKTNGTGFVSGSFFAGQIIETNFNTGTTSASVTHNSAGNDVEITVNSTGYVTVIAGSAPGPTGASTYTLSAVLKRGTTTIKTFVINVSRIIEFELGDYTTRDYYSFSDVFIDTTTLSAAYTYSITVDPIPIGSPTQNTSIKTFEDLLTS